MLQEYDYIRKDEKDFNDTVEYDCGCIAMKESYTPSGVDTWVILEFCNDHNPTLEFKKIKYYECIGCKKKIARHIQHVILNRTWTTDYVCDNCYKLHEDGKL